MAFLGRLLARVAWVRVKGEKESGHTSLLIYAIAPAAGPLVEVA